MGCFMNAQIPPYILQAADKLLSEYGVNLTRLLDNPAPNAVKKKKYFTVVEAMEYTGLGRHTLIRAARAGYISQVKLGNCRKAKVLIEISSIDKWLNGYRDRRINKHNSP